MFRQCNKTTSWQILKWRKTVVNVNKFSLSKDDTWKLLGIKSYTKIIILQEPNICKKKQSIYDVLVVLIGVHRVYSCVSSMCRFDVGPCPGSVAVTAASHMPVTTADRSRTDRPVCRLHYHWHAACHASNISDSTNNPPFR